MKLFWSLTFAFIALSHPNVLAAEVATTRSPGSVDPRPRTQTSDWGSYQNGLQCRVVVPFEIEEGMPIRAVVELRSDPQALEPGVRALNNFQPSAFLSLSMTNETTGAGFTIQPFTLDGGPPVYDDGRASLLLDGTRIPNWQASFPLATLYHILQPGTYQCLVEYSFPTNQTRWWRGDATAWQKAGFWHGTVASGPFVLTVRPETPAITTWLLPKRLRLEKVLQRGSGEKDAPLIAAPRIRFRSADGEKGFVRLRNGHFVGTRCECTGGNMTMSVQGGPPKPDDVNAIVTWYAYRGGNRTAEITMTVFETAEPPMQQVWLPGPGYHGYRVLWTSHFKISLIERSFRSQSAVALDLSKFPATTDARLASLLAQNRSLETLSLDHTAITDAGLKRVAGLKRLETLHLYDTKITDAGLNYLKRLPNLKSLSLSGTKITDAGVGQLRGLVGLESLDLARTSITDASLENLRAMPHLRFLYLIETQVRDEGLVFLSGLTNLEMLFLSRTLVSDAGLASLKLLPRLKLLRLDGTQVSGKGLDELRLSLPDCSVEKD